MRVESARAGRARRQMGFGARSLMAFAVCLLVSVLSAGLFALASASGNTPGSFIQAQPGAIPWNQHDRLSMLLLGLGHHGNDPTYANTLMVVSFDPGGHTLTLFSVPDTLWVNIPGYGSAPIGEAYVDGGARLALFTLQSVLHTAVPYYAAVDEASYRQLIDAFGGVNVPAGTSISGQTRPDRSNHLTGSQLLQIDRARQSSGHADIRESRQQRLALAVLHQILQPSDFFQIPTIVTSLGGSIPTNFPYSQIPGLARSLLGVPANRIRRVTIGQTNGTAVPYASNGSHYLLPNWQGITSLAHRVLPESLSPYRAAVAVWNATSTPGQAASLAAWLRQSGIRTGSINSASLAQHTQVLLKSHATPAQRHVAERASILLQVPLVTLDVHRGGNPVTVLIGQDYQPPFQG